MALDLWQLRRQKRMTIEELARTAGVHPALIKAYELGERSIPERDLERLASALEIDVEEIKELSDPPPRGPSRPAAPSPLEGDAPRPRYDSGSRYDSGPRYDSGSGSRYDSGAGSRYDSGSGSRYDSGRPSYGRSDSGRSGYGSSEGRSSYGGGEAGRSGYGEGRSGYGGGEAGRSGYGSSNYGRGYGDRPAPRYDSDRPAPRYDSDRGPARPPRPDYRPDRPDQPDRMERRPERPPRKPGGLKRRPQVAPARPSQLEHLKILLQQLDMSGDDLLRLAGKPLSMLNRREASHLLTTCQEMLTERKPERPKGKRQRPYLPESVDEHELVYLTQVQLDESPLHLTLFNGTTLAGTLQGFSPYALTLTTDSGDEITVQKLAIAYYQVKPSPAQEAAGQDGES